MRHERPDAVLQSVSIKLHTEMNLTYLTRLMQLLENFLQLSEITPIKVQLSQFCVRFKPEPIVFRILQRVQCGLVEVLKQFHLKGKLSFS